MTRLNFGGVLIEGGLSLCVFVEHGRKSVEVFEKIRIRQVTTSEVGQESWQPNKYSDREEGRLIADTQVVEGGEEKAGRLFFW